MNAWYALLLLGLVALTGRIEWLALALLMTVAMVAGPLWGNGVGLRTAAYGLAAAIALTAIVARRYRADRVTQSPVR